MSDFSERLTKAERDRSFDNVRPRDASTLIIVDRSDGNPKVLLGKRHHGHKFMPGKFVFPGGRLESADRLMPVASDLNPVAEKCHRCSARAPPEPVRWRWRRSARLLRKPA